MRAFLVALLLGGFLGGCAGEAVQPPASDLRMPEARLMVRPADLPGVAKQASLYSSDVQCRAQYVTETGKLESLQGYVRKLHAK